MYEQRKRIMISLFIKKTLHCGFLHNTITHLKHVIYIYVYLQREKWQKLLLKKDIDIHPQKS